MNIVRRGEQREGEEGSEGGRGETERVGREGGRGDRERERSKKKGALVANAPFLLCRK